MEYFAAGQLAATSDTPEELAPKLAPLVHSDNWHVVGELAVKLKGDTTDRRADLPQADGQAALTSSAPRPVG
jgi:hypothetical protein